MDSRHVTGEYGEDLARVFLRESGYEIIRSNWRCTEGEIDIVARNGKELVFVEVRTRHADSTDAALSSISPLKAKHMTAAAYAYLHETQQEDHPWRIDVILIGLRRDGTVALDHVEDALAW